MAEYNSYIDAAKYAESAERYDDMAKCMKDAVKVAPTEDGFLKITVDDRNLLSVAYKNAVGSRRSAWRVVSSVEEKYTSTNPSSNPEDVKLAAIAEYKEKIVKELDELCKEVQVCLCGQVSSPASVKKIDTIQNHAHFSNDILNGAKFNNHRLHCIEIQR